MRDQEYGRRRGEARETKNGGRDALGAPPIGKKLAVASVLDRADRSVAFGFTLVARHYDFG